MFRVEANGIGVGGKKKNEGCGGGELVGGEEGGVGGGGEGGEGREEEEESEEEDWRMKHIYFPK